MKTAKKMTGATLASAAAILLLAGCSSNSGSIPSDGYSESKAKAAKVHCSGVNSCKGTSDCATATSACKGHNSCKGKGWISMTKEECDAKGGKVTG